MEELWEAMVRTLEIPAIGIKVSEVRLGAPEWALDVIKKHG